MIRPLGAFAAVLMVVGAVAVALGRGDGGPGVDEARLEVDGRALVTSADGTVEEVTGSQTLAFGDTVVMQEGAATMELAAGQQYELRSGEIPTELVVGAPPTLLAGDVLVAGGFPAGVTHQTTTLMAQGALKVRAEVPSATAYAGRTRISGAGALGEVLGLRHVVLTPSAVPEPLTYEPADPWDRRYLGDAIAFGERLEALARGFTGDLRGGGSRSVSFFTAVIPALGDEREFAADLIGDRPPGEILVGASIAVQGRRGTFRERWSSVFAFRDAGAAWGLVALDQGVSSAPVLETIELAIGGAPDAPAPTSTTTAPTTTTTSGSVDRSTTSTTGTTTTTAPPPDDPGLLEPALDPVDDLLSEVLQALGIG